MPGGATLWVTGAVVLALTAVLSLPVRVEYSARFEHVLEWIVRVRFATFLVVSSSAARSPSAVQPGATGEPPRTEARRAATVQSTRDRRAAGWRSLLGDRLFRRHAWRILRKCLARVQSRRFSAACTFGCSDPADTGVLYGAVAPWIVALGAAPSVRVTPVFTGAELTASVAGEVRLVPLALLGPMLALGAAALRAARRSGPEWR